MLLVYTYREISSYCVYVGETLQFDPAIATRVVADEQELSRILGWGYPDHGQRQQTYLGDTARQILFNW